MSDYLMAGQLGLLVVIFVLLLVLLIRLSSQKGRSGDSKDQFIELQRTLERQERFMYDQFSRSREEQSQSQHAFANAVMGRMTDIATVQNHQMGNFAKQLVDLTNMNELKLERVRATVEERLLALQADNEQKLEQMRVTVDEKLHATLEQRLGESFKLVSERLEKVHQGLGEMQNLATGVGDLKRVLTNVKARGIWGEVQLSQILEQYFTSEQYATNVPTKPGSNDRVEFAIKLPARDPAQPFIWLPVDAKFPLEDYQRLQEAQDQGKGEQAELYGKALENRIKLEAKGIREKYLAPPYTTDFAILFLPTEGLYAEILRRPGLCDLIQREFRVVLSGPTTIAAFLNSLQMGFRTLAIERRSSEVWALLGAVKAEFGKFGDLLEKTQKKLQEAGASIENAAKKSRSIERKLNDVQELPCENGEESPNGKIPASGDSPLRKSIKIQKDLRSIKYHE